MIVSCPSCGTRYKHQAAADVAAAAGRCSQCDDMVPLVVAGRPYLILPAGSGEQTGMRIGMDDPRLAEQLSRTALDAGSEESPAALSYRIADDPAGIPSESSARGRRFSGANGSAPAIFEKRRSWLRSSKTRKRSKALGAEPGDNSSVSPRSRALELAIMGVLTVVGAATAYFSAAEYGLHPPTWIAAGGGLGLFMAWICLRWTRQR
jgi:hypothetical protein